MELKTLKIDKVIDNEWIIIHPVLLQIENRNYLIDCGYEETFDELISEIESHGIGLLDLTGVIITHDDYDHLGSLNLLKQKNKKLKIYSGKYEMESISGVTKSERLIQAESSLEFIANESKDWALNFIKKLKNTNRVKVDIGLNDYDIFEQDIVIIHTPGHTKGHISLFYTKDKVLIAGDSIVIEDDELNIANPSFTLDMKSAIKSLEKIVDLNPHKIICYHGGVIDNNINKRLKELITKYKNYTHQKPINSLN